MNTVLFGGTFDPVHIGHLMVAEVVNEKLNPSEVVFVPAASPWLKSDRHISPAGDRINMVGLAILRKLYCRLSTVETERSGPSYTIDTLRDVKARISVHDDLYFVIGLDNLLDLARWREPSGIISLAKIVAVPRIGFRVPNAETLENIVPGLSKRVILLDKPEIDVSASIIRERVARNLPIDHMVPPLVADYIRQKGLYRKAVSSPIKAGKDG